ncbi:MAG TPA: ribonuclease Z [Cytophagales bacterium]|nr:ribonuclease Z [Cytophagales bacterium]HAA24322.1 ribonuclease Z [Cytophagales bacterium]HAP63979.1 ribonuclease Z [Cytophagales bacterium]
MSQFAVQVLGASSAAPAHGRNQSAQLLLVNGRQYLIDCGEGTQHQFFRFKIRPFRLNHIFISHLHGDHYLGLVGLLSTLHLQKREHELTVYGPEGLEEIVAVNLKYSETELNFPIRFVVTDHTAPQELLRDDRLTIRSFPLSHRVPTTGFVFKEHPKPYRIIKEKLPENILLQEIALFKQGKDVLHEDGSVKYAAAEHTLPPKRSRQFAYCSDTRYLPEIVPHLSDTDLLYHEATFGVEMAARAAETFHSTAQEAAQIATQSGVRRLMIGHYSTRYRDLQPLLEEAQAVFPETQLALEGEITEIPEL